MNTQQIDLQIIEERQTAKKRFVEPEVSGPVDVLEATAFFVAGTLNTDVPVGFD